MERNRAYFFCGIGGSGMLPLALILKDKGHPVSGSDRARDQGRTPEKFAYLEEQGIRLFPQDGSGVASPDTTVVTSTAVEDTIADVQAAKRAGARLITRAQLLAELFNAAPLRIGIAGTSGKSTTTGMIGWILQSAGRDPTIMNGAVMNNFVTERQLFASARLGKGEIFVSEVDESDGSIAQFDPSIAVLNNVTLDHKAMDELRVLFGDFLAKAETAVMNWDDAETRALARTLPSEKMLTYSLNDADATIFASDIKPSPGGIDFVFHEGASRAAVSLRMPGRHNVENALAALAAARACGITFAQAAKALEGFIGLRRRLEIVGSANGITVIDDFAHNPDKIAATLATLHDFPGRLLVMFQPHGFGPLKLMREGFIKIFGNELARNDVLVMPDPVYYGGTVERSVSSDDIVAGVRAKGREAYAFSDRTQCGEKLLDLARAGDRIVVMGARDDTLSTFAAGLLAKLRTSSNREGMAS